MNRRDYFIIFCLLLPFFITLPWLIVSRQALGQQKELVELTRDTLHINNLKCARLQLSSEQYIESNKALEKNNQILVQKLTERGVKVVTQELPPNPKFFTENNIAQQKKIAELISANEQLRAQIETLQRGDSPASPVLAPTLPPVSAPITTASQQQVPPPNRKKGLGPPLMEAAPAPQALASSRTQRRDGNKPVVKNAPPPPTLSTINERRETSEPGVEIVTSTVPIPASNQHKETTETLEANATATERVSAPNQNKEMTTTVVAGKPISAPVVSSASPPQPTKNKTPLNNPAPKRIRIIAIGERMQEQITRAGIEGLTGENFGVNLFLKEAIEASSSTLQRIVVEFDVKNVPPIYHGVRDVFLVLTDRSGEVVITPQSTTANVPFNGSMLSLKTTAKARAEFSNAQHLRIQQNLSVPLAEGRYRAQIYCDLAVLGIVDFEVL